jgi:hypothetical protein
MFNGVGNRGLGHELKGNAAPQPLNTHETRRRRQRRIEFDPQFRRAIRIFARAEAAGGRLVTSFWLTRIQPKFAEGFARQNGMRRSAR